MRNFVLFKTELFVFHQRDKDINRWFVGGDCAGWFYPRLLPVDRIGPFCEPGMEDWGWTFGVAVDKVRVWVNVWAYSIENCWLFGIAPKRQLFRRETLEGLQSAKDKVCDTLDEILTRDSRILKRKWFLENPFDLNIQDF